MRTEADWLREDYRELRNTFAWYVRTNVAERVGSEALTRQTIDLMIDDYVAAHGNEPWKPLQGELERYPR